MIIYLGVVSGLYRVKKRLRYFEGHATISISGTYLKPENLVFLKTQDVFSRNKPK